MREVRGVDTVGRGLDLAGPGGDGAHGACVRHRQRVRAAHAEAHVLRLRHGFIDPAHEAAERVRQHVPRCVADGHASRTGHDRGLQRLSEEGGIGARGVVREEFHVLTDRPRRRDGLADRLEHGGGLFAREVFHLHGADRRGDLDARVLRLFERGPDQRNARRVQRDRHAHGAFLHRRGDGFDEQTVDLRVFDRVQLNDAHAQPVEELGKLDLLAERERIARGLARLADRGICHGNVFHRRFLLFSENKKPLKPTGFRDEIASRYHPAYPPPHGGRSLSDSDKSMACNAAGRALLLNKRRSQCLLGNQTAACASLPAHTSRRLSETCTAGTNFRHRSCCFRLMQLYAHPGVPVKRVFVRLRHFLSCGQIFARLTR